MVLFSAWQRKLCIVWAVQPKQYTVYAAMQKTVGNVKENKKM